MLRCLVFSTTNCCPIECRYCAVECSPRNNQYLSFNDMTAVIDSVLSLGLLEVVVFTGGEPFLLGETLYKILHYCKERGLKTRIVTNAYWANTPEKASHILNRCIEAGLTEINISVDDYHQAFIPLENVLIANELCRELGLQCMLGHKLVKDGELTLQVLESKIGRQLAIYQRDKKPPMNDVVITGYAVPISKNMHMIPDTDILYPDNDSQWKSPCTSVMENIVITTSRELSICCGMIPREVREVIIGSLDDFSIEELILKANQDFIVNWLALEGPYGIMKYLLKQEPTLKFRERYVSTCHLCSEIFTRDDCRQILEKVTKEKIVELSLERSLWNYIQSRFQELFPNLNIT